MSDPTHTTGIDQLSDETRARQREEQAAMRRRSDRRAKGLVIVNTGNGKGKTTAALGLLLRAAGQGLRVVMFEFIKAKSGNWGEVRAALIAFADLVTEMREVKHPYHTGIKAQKGIEF